MSKNNIRKWLVSGALALPVLPVCAVVSPAAAQSGSEIKLEEIVVTSRRQTERLSEVPDSIAVMDAGAIERQRIGNITDIASMTPNIGWKQDLSPTSTFISVRGISSTRNTDPAISVWIDGIQMSSASQLRQELFDVQQIEVLKGPQGALYGRNALGGAIVVTTNQPSNEVTGKFTASYGNADRMDATAAVSGPIIEDELFFRVSGSFHDDNGSIRNTTLNTNADFDTSKALRGRLAWMPSDKTEVGLRASYDHYEGGNYYYDVTRAFGAPFPVADPDSNSNTFDATSPLSNPISVAVSEVYVVSGNVEHEMDFANLSAVVAYDSTEERYGIPGEGVGGSGPGDLDFGPAPIIGNSQAYDVDSIQAEVRLSSVDASAPLRWVVGVYGIDIDRHDTLPVYQDLNANNDLSDDAPFFPNGTERNIKAYAGFGQINYDVASNLELTLGIRYDKEERDQTNLDEVDPTIATQDAEFDLFQPKASLAWKVTDDQLLYATVSRGFRSGGFNTPRSAFDDIYDQEELWSYELGYKGTLADGAVYINGAFFYEDITNKQDFVFDAATAAQIIYNIPDSEVYGIEADVTWRATEDLTLRLSGGYMDSKIKEFQFGALFPTPQVDAAIEGNKLPTFSHWTVNTTVDYVTPVGSGDWEFFAHVDYSVRGDNYWSITNLDQEKNVHLVNANLGFQNEKWKVTVWSENLTNTKYWSNWFNQDTTALPDIGQRAEERRYGVQLQMTF